MVKMKRNPATHAVSWLTLTALLVPTAAGISFIRTTHAQSSEASLTATKNSQSALSRYAVDLTQLAAQGKLEALVGFDAEINRVIATLANSNTKAPVLISDSDVNRAAVARTLAMRIVSGDAPETLRGKRVLSLNIDALARGAKTSEQFEQRLQSVFAEMAEAGNGIILFVDQLHQYAGSRATATANATIKSAISARAVQMVAGVSDENSREVRSLLARSGVLVGDSMAKLGAIKVDLPAHVVETLMQNETMNFISPDVKIESFGHVNATTGADQIRNAPGLIGSLLGATAIDGTGITIAIIDSGMDLSHVAFQPSGRVKFKKDFTPENKPDKDYYGHGSHVAALAAGNYTNGTGTSYQGIAYNANFVNLRVLDSNGAGSTSTLLAALNWILTPADPSKPLSSSNPLNKDKYAIRVVNMSLGAPAVGSYQNDPICRASRALVDAGIVVIAA